MRRLAVDAPRQRPWTRAAIGLAVLALGPAAARAQDQAQAAPPVTVVELLQGGADRVAERGLAWYRGTPPWERVTWGGLAAAGLLGALTLLERLVRLRRGRVVPRAFRERFHSRLVEGALREAQALDYCELNPSPAARVALAAVRRWGRPVNELERAVALARQAEVDRLRRNVGTLRRIAALAPLIGLLGSLLGLGRALAELPAGAAWGPVVAQALAPLTAGVALAIVALVAYDGLVGRVEALSGTLERLGAEAVDALAIAGASASPPRPVRPEPAAGPRAPHAASTDAVPAERDRFARPRQAQRGRWREPGERQA
jgi:biopolymer transport protein ExbB